MEICILEKLNRSGKDTGEMGISKQRHGASLLVLDTLGATYGVLCNELLQMCITIFS